MPHSHNNAHNVSGKKLMITIILNLLITLSQLIGGIAAHSLALLSDALHNFSDVMALTISYIANRLANLSFTEKRTFGYKRAEIIAALINVITLFVIAILLLKEAVSSIIHPAPVNSFWVMVLAGFSIVMNLLSVLLIHEDSKDNLNIKSAYIHLLTDVLTSVVVLIGGILIKFYNIYWIDGVLSILISIFLLYTSVKIFMETLNILMDFTPAEINIKDIEHEILKFDQIKNVHHIHIWRLNDHDVNFEGHIEFKENISLREATEVVEKITRMLEEKFHITHCVIQPEYGAKDQKDLIVERPYHDNISL